MQLIIGTNLTQAQKRQVKAAFVHRLTTENGYPARNPCGAWVEAITDNQWLAEHAFYITKSGDLSHTPNYCEPAFMAKWQP